MKKQLTIKLHPEFLATMDDACKRDGMSRNQMIEHCFMQVEAMQADINIAAHHLTERVLIRALEILKSQKK